MKFGMAMISGLAMLMMMFMGGGRLGIAAEKSGTPGADANTLALWLFDEPQYLRMTLTDAGPNLYDLRLLDSGQMVPGRFGHALRVSASAGPAVAYPCDTRTYDERGFSSKDSWIIRPPVLLSEEFGRQAWTIEFWLKSEPSTKSTMTLLDWGYPGRPAVRMSLGGEGFTLEGEAFAHPWFFPAPSENLSDGQWHHVALVKPVKKNAVLFVDGRRQASARQASPASPPPQTPNPGLIGMIFESQVASPLGLENPVNVKAAGSIDFYWGEARDLSWREAWRGMIQSPTEGEVEFFIDAHDGANLNIGDQTVIDGWKEFSVRSGRIMMRRGEIYPFRFAFRQLGSTPHCRLHWRLPGEDWALVPAEAFSYTPGDIEHAMQQTRQVARSRFYFALGSGWPYERPMEGLFDELRISNVARYDKDFSPATFSRNYGPTPSAPLIANGPKLLFDGGRGDTPVMLGSRKHVFIDEVMLEARKNVHLRMNPPRMDRPTNLRNDRPWEHPEPIMFGDSSFYEDEGTIRFHYNNGNMWRGNSQDNFYSLATSKDGIHFDKPDLKHVPWGDVRRTNILLRCPVQGRFFKDSNPNVLAEERYKFTAFQMHRGVYLFTSPDGLQWRRNETIMLPFDIGGGVESFWDDQRGLYVSFVRNEGWTDWREPFGRAVARAQSADPFKPWPFEPAARPSFLAKAWSLPSITTELPTAFAPKDIWSTNPQCFTREGQIYRSRAIKYPWAPDTYVAFHWRLYGIPDKEQRQSELAVSRDGVQWRVYDEPYLPYGVQFEGAKVIESLAMDGLVRRGDELWHYAELRFAGHKREQFKESKDANVMMRYKQRLDGFVALETRQLPGWVLTRPFIFDGNRLELNIEASQPVYVALLDECEAAIPGYSLAECDPIKVDSTHHVVTWGGRSDVRPLAGRPVRLRFEMEDARIFAFQFIPNPAGK